MVASAPSLQQLANGVSVVAVQPLQNKEDASIGTSITLNPRETTEMKVLE